MRKDKFSVLVLGLDGATFDLMLPWIEQGHLPELGGLIERGASGPLQSTIPPITPCAWSSFMTGKNPGKHGLFDFVEPLSDGKGFRFTNAASRHAETLWGLLGRKGHRVGVVNVPMTYPPETVNGYLISGLDTPDERSPYMHPGGLDQELRGQGINYRLDPRHLGNMRTDRRRRRWLRELCEIETIRTDTLRYMRGRYPSTFTMLVYSATDQVQHHFWHYMDPGHDKYEPQGAKQFGHAIRDVYIHMDRLIGSTLRELGDETIVVIMSDHGFGPVRNTRIRFNQALEQAGLLNFASEGTSGRTVRAAAAMADRLLRSTLPPAAKRWLASLLPKFRVWFERLDEAAVDWDRTAAYANEVSRCFPAVWLNRSEAGHTPGDEAERETTLTAVRQALLELIDPDTGRPAISNVYRMRDVCHGPYTASAPDLVPSWWEDGFLAEQSVPGGPAELIVEHSRAAVTGGVEFAGSHRLDGVFIMTGGPVRQGLALEGTRIIDVAPTVLHLMGLPIPDDMDGRPLVDALEPEFVADHPPIFESSQEADQSSSDDNDAAFTEEESELIARRLRSLGYIE